MPKSVHFNLSAVLLQPNDSLPSKDVHCRSLYLNLSLHPTTTVRDLHSKRRTFWSRWPWVKQENMFTVLSGLHTQIISFIITFRTLTPICLQSSILWHTFFRFLAPQRYVPVIFGIKKPSRFKRTGRHFESFFCTWTYSCLCPTPTNTYTKTIARLWTTRQTWQGGEIWENVFNPGTMHKLIV